MLIGKMFIQFNSSLLSHNTRKELEAVRKSLEMLRWPNWMYWMYGMTTSRFWRTPTVYDGVLCLFSGSKTQKCFTK